MANTTVGIVFEVFNRGTSGFASIRRDLGRTTTQLMQLAGLGAGLYGLERAYKSVTTAAMVQERAEADLHASLARTGDATAENISQLKSYASAIQRVTTYGDQQILQQMTYAHNVGAATDQLDEATVAAIGLAAAYDKDLRTAMRLVALAAKGETGQLKEMGIVISQNLSPQERYNQLIAIGTKNFELAAKQTQDTEGRHRQLLNAWGDTKETIGSALLPSMKTLFETMQGYLEQNQQDVRAWAEGTVRTLAWVAQKYAESQRGFGDLVEAAVAPGMIEKAARERYKLLHPEDTTAFRQKFYPGGFGGGVAETPPKDKAAYERIRQQLINEQRGLEAARRYEREHPQAPAANRLPGTYELPTLNLTASGTDGASAAEQIAQQVTALDGMLAKLGRENELLGMNAAERQWQVVLDQARHAAQEDFNDGLRTTADLTADEVRAVGQLVAERQRLDQAAAQREFNIELDQTIPTLRQEADLAGLTNKERERETILQNAANEALRRGVQLTAAQREELEQAVEAMQRARDMADMTFGQGFALGIRDMQDELKTAGQIGYDLSIMLRDGVVGAINDAVFRAEDLGDALEQVGLKMLEYWAQEAMWKPLMTQGMNFGTQLLGNLAGSLAGGWFGGSAGVTAGGQTSMFGASSVATAIVHTGGVAGRDIFPTRIVPASVLAHAPRFHTGVGPGERAAVIRDEEGVFTPGQMRALGRGLGGDHAAFGEMAGLLGQILAAVRERQTLNATLVDKRQTPQEWFESRQGEQAWKYHAARNG